MVQALVLAYFVLFPFGQLPGVVFQILADLPFRVHATDLVVLAALIWFVLGVVRKKITTPIWAIYGFEFVALGVVVSVITGADYIGLLYAIRLISYIAFAALVYESKFVNSGLIKNGLLAVVCCAALLGWVQYFVFPDLTSLKALGWDDHYFRLSGMFLDPAFIGVLLALGIILATWQKNQVAMFLLIPTLAFTYSRASWLALLAGLVLFLYKKINVKHTILSVVVLAFAILVLPNPGGEGTNLARVNSGIQKIENVRVGLGIISTSPLFGVGLNNVCKVKDFGSPESQNSCYGLDNSLLFILSSSGVLGLFMFMRFATRFASFVDVRNHTLALSVVFCIFTHATFTNTLFYPWVMGWVGLLFVSLRRIRDA